MKDTIKMVISHFFIITVCVTAAIGISNMFVPGQQGYPKEFPLHLLLVGSTSALPSFLFYFKGEPTRRQFIIRIILHFICIMGVVLGEGYFLRWYGSALDMAIVAGLVVLVYAAVWIITMRSNTKAEQGINEALKRFNTDDNEEE